MPLHRRLTFVLAAIALGALAVFAILWLGARTPLARNWLAGRIADATGLPTTIGSLGIGVLPSPALEIGTLALAQPRGFEGGPFLEVRRVRVSLPWRSVFSPTRLNAVVVSEPTARLIVRADGESNWSALFPEPAAGAPPPERSSWALGALGLERGTIDYLDQAADSRWQLTAISAAAENVAPAVEFPLKLSLGGLFGPNTIHYALQGRGRLDPDAGRYEASALEFRGWIGGDPLPLAGVELTGGLGRAAYESRNGVARLEAGRFQLAGIPGRFEGSLDLDEPDPVAALKMVTEPFAPRAPAIIFGQPLPRTTDPAALESLQLALEARTREGRLALDPVSGRLDETNFEARIVPAERLVRASLDRIDLNRYLPPATKTAGTKKATLEAVVAELAAFDLDAQIRIAEARVAGARIRDAVIRVERNDGGAP